MSPEETCSVCGRTILAGERTRAYVSTAGHRDVCELCAPRAERLGWQRERAGMPAALPQPEGRGLLGRLFGRRERRGGEEVAPDPVPEPLAEATEADEGVAAAPAAKATPVPAAERSAEPAAPEREPSPRRPARSPDPAAPGARPQRLDPEPTRLSPFERAVVRFSSSDAARTVAGLVRTLGPPWVSVGASAGAPKEIRITVAWELSWYQWGVDLGDELRPVFQIDKGLEMDQLDAAARQWNASAVEGGRIVLVAPSRRRRPDGEPVSR